MEGVRASVIQIMSTGNEHTGIQSKRGGPVEEMVKKKWHGHTR